MGYFYSQFFPLLLDCQGESPELNVYSFSYKVRSNPNLSGDGQNGKESIPYWLFSQ